MYRYPECYAPSSPNVFVGDSAFTYEWIPDKTFGDGRVKYSKMKEYSTQKY